MRRKGKKRLLAALHTFAIPAGDEPPTEFQVFSSGWVSSRKGKVLFDATAAAATIKEYQTHGVDLMIDLEHLSLDVWGPHFDPDARGWCRLELRDGALWAVGVTWTEDGERRLRKKTQRYISPAFRVDPDTKRVTELVNIAITALPATDNLEPLVAATRKDNTVDEETKKLLAALAALAQQMIDSENEELNALGAKLMEAAKELLGEDTEGAAAEGAADAAASASIVAAARKLTGGKDAKAIVAALAARFSAKPAGPVASSAVSDALANEVKSLSQRLAQREVRDVIATHRDKFTPALEAWALTKTPTEIEEWAKLAPVVSPAERQEKKREKSTEVQLTDADREVCKLTGISHKDFLAHKKQQLEEAAG